LRQEDVQDQQEEEKGETMLNKNAGADKAEAGGLVHSQNQRESEGGECRVWVFLFLSFLNVVVNFYVEDDCVEDDQGHEEVVVE
jgi:hypothetical protein